MKYKEPTETRYNKPNLLSAVYSHQDLARKGYETSSYYKTVPTSEEAKSLKSGVSSLQIDFGKLESDTAMIYNKLKLNALKASSQSKFLTQEGTSIMTRGSSIPRRLETHEVVVYDDFKHFRREIEKFKNKLARQKLAVEDYVSSKLSLLVVEFDKTERNDDLGETEKCSYLMKRIKEIQKEKDSLLLELNRTSNTSDANIQRQSDFSANRYSKRAIQNPYMTCNSFRTYSEPREDSLNEENQELKTKVIRLKREIERLNSDYQGRIADLKSELSSNENIFKEKIKGIQISIDQFMNAMDNLSEAVMANDDENIKEFRFIMENKKKTLLDITKDNSSIYRTPKPKMKGTGFNITSIRGHTTKAQSDTFSNANYSEMKKKYERKLEEWKKNEHALKRTIKDLEDKITRTSRNAPSIVKSTIMLARHKITTSIKGYERFFLNKLKNIEYKTESQLKKLNKFKNVIKALNASGISSGTKANQMIKFEERISILISANKELKADNDKLIEEKLKANPKEKKQLREKVKEMQKIIKRYEDSAFKSINESRARDSLLKMANLQVNNLNKKLEVAKTQLTNSKEFVNPLRSFIENELKMLKENVQIKINVLNSRIDENIKSTNEFMKNRKPNRKNSIAQITQEKLQLNENVKKTIRIAVEKVTKAIIENEIWSIIHSHESKIYSLESVVIMFEEHFVNHNAKIITLETENMKLTNELKTLEEENNKLKRELRENIDISSSSLDIRKAKKYLQSIANEMNDKLVGLNKNISKSIMKNTKSDEISKKMGNLSKSYIYMKLENNKLQASISENQKLITKLQKEYKKLVTEKRAQSNLFNIERDKMINEMGGHSRTIIEENKKSLINMKSKLENSYNEEKERLEESIKDLERKLNDALKNNDKLIEGNDALSKENHALIITTQNFDNENKSLNAKNDSLVDENNLLNDKNKSLISKNESLTNSNKSLSDENKSLINENTSLIKEKENLVNDKLALSSESQSMINKLENLTIEYQNLKNKYESLVSESQALSSKNKDLAKENQKSNNETKKSIKTRDRLEQSISKAKEKIMMTKNGMLNNSTKLIMTNLDKLRVFVDSINKKLNNIQKISNKKNGYIMKLQASFELINNKCKSSEDNRSKLLLENESLSTEISKKSNEINSLRETIKNEQKSNVLFIEEFKNIIENLIKDHKGKVDDAFSKYSNLVSKLNGKIKRSMKIHSLSNEKLLDEIKKKEFVIEEQKHQLADKASFIQEEIEKNARGKAELEDALITKKNQIDELTMSIEQYKSALSGDIEKNKLIEELQNKLKISEEKIEEFKASLKNTKADNRKVKKLIKEFNNRLSAKINELDNRIVNSDHFKCEMILNKIQCLRDVYILKLEDAKEKIKNYIISIDKRVTSYREKANDHIELFYTQVGRISRKFQTLENIMKTFEAKLEEKKRTTEQNEEVQKNSREQLKNLSLKIQMFAISCNELELTFTEKINEKTNDVKALNDKIISFNKTQLNNMNEISQLKNKVEELNKTVEDKVKIITERDNEIEQYNCSINELIEKQSKQSILVDNYKQELLTCKKVIRELAATQNQMLAKLKVTIATMKSFIDNSRSKANQMIYISSIIPVQLEENIQVETQENARLKKRISSLEKELEITKEKLKNANDELITNRHLLDGSKMELRKIQNELENAKLKLVKINEEDGRGKAETQGDTHDGNEELEMELNKVKSELQREQDRNKIIEEKYSDMITNIREEAEQKESELNEIIDDLKDENNQLKEKIGNDPEYMNPLQEKVSKSLVIREEYLRAALEVLNSSLNKFTSTVYEMLEKYRRLPDVISKKFFLCINNTNANIQAISESYMTKMENLSKACDNHKEICEKLRRELKKYRKNEEEEGKDPRYALRRLSTSVARKDSLNGTISDNESVGSETSSNVGSVDSNTSKPPEVTPEMVTDVGNHLKAVIVRCLSLIPLK